MSVRKSFAWAFAGQLLTFCATFAGTIIIARLLSPYEMGIYAIALAASGVVQVVANLGVGAYIIREHDLLPETVDAAFTINAIAGVILAATIFVVGLMSRPLLGDVAAGHVLQVIALSPLVGIFTFRPQSLLQREMQFKRIAMVNVAASLSGTITTVTCALLGVGYMSLAFGAVALPTVTAIGFNLIAPHHASLRLSLGEWRRITAFGLRIMSISGVSVLSIRLAEIAIGRVLGLSMLGIYARASSLSNMIFENVYGTMTRVIFTKLARDFRETGELRRGFVQGLTLVTALMWPLLIGIAILSGPVILLLFGERWLAAAGPLSVLMVMQFVGLCYGMNWELFVLRDETAKQTRLEITRAAIGLAAVVIACHYGIMAAAGGRAVEAAAGLLLYARHVQRLAGTARGEIARLLAHNALLLVPATGPAFLVMAYNNFSSHTSLLQIMPAVSLGIALWLATLAWTKHLLWTELMMILSQVPGMIRSRRPA